MVSTTKNKCWTLTFDVLKSDTTNIGALKETGWTLTFDVLKYSGPSSIFMESNVEH